MKYNNYEILESLPKYNGKYVKVFEEKIKLPDDREAIFENVIRKNATAIIPVNEKGEVILVKQYRPAIKKETLEIPAGLIEEGEKPKDCALRELEEETSFKAGKLNFMFSIHPAVGFCNEKIFIYLATNLTKGEFNFDDNEFINIEKYKIYEAINLVFSGEITDSKTIVALLALKNFLNN